MLVARSLRGGVLVASLVVGVVGERASLSSFLERIKLTAQAADGAHNGFEALGKKALSRNEQYVIGAPGGPCCTDGLSQPPLCAIAQGRRAQFFTGNISGSAYKSSLLCLWGGKVEGYKASTNVSAAMSKDFVDSFLRFQGAFHAP